MVSVSSSLHAALPKVKLIGIVCTALLLAGCQTLGKSLPEGYAGPTASIRDSVKAEAVERSWWQAQGVSQADFFYVAKVDGRPVNNSLRSTAWRYEGLGTRFEPQLMDRPVPARRTTLTIEGRTHYGAPIVQLLSDRKYPPVSGDIAFTPRPGRQYVVKGQLSQTGSSVWIADARTGRAVTRKIRN